MCSDALLIVVGENQENGSHVSSQLNVSTDWTHQIGDCSLKRFYTADCGETVVERTANRRDFCGMTTAAT